eukprot:TRINITY_DN8022_c0_g1_i1.p1 TRINITY_DN8022_c0_g1~~TRINITY_DN8022_c0_g1_i1.p1  ORF type:complete len:145 (+),score=6.68 TRINITY_DN8022_c0_g1_i1:79-513(+)
MKVLFLDVDGVLLINPREGFRRVAMLQLKRIIDETDARIVVSSTWRYFRNSLDRLKLMLQNAGIPEILSTTPSLRHKTRQDEILTWIQEWNKQVGNEKVTSWVAIDDIELDSDARLEDHFVKIDPEIGLDEISANLVITMLNLT